MLIQVLVTDIEDETLLTEENVSDLENKIIENVVQAVRSGDFVFGAYTLATSPVLGMALYNVSINVVPPQKEAKENV